MGPCVGPLHRDALKLCFMAVFAVLRRAFIHAPHSMKLVRAFLSTLFIAMASCKGESIYRDLAEPLDMEDYLVLPSEVTSDNASLAVRRSLQAHRRSISTPDEQTGYAFRPHGFVQLYHAHSVDREDERGVRTYVDFNAISSIRVEPFFDVQFLKDRFRLILEGDFPRWESHIRAFGSQPDLGAELDTRTVKSVTLVLDDATIAQLLSQALLLLSHLKQR